MHPLLKLALEIGPLALFFIVFTQLNDPSGGLSDTDALMAATATFMAALAVSLGVTYALTRELSRMAIFTAAVVAVTGGLTLLLRDEIFIKMKPTLVNGAFAAVLFVGLAQGRSYLAYMLESMLPMKPEGWMKLTRNWAFFFVFMAVLNEVVWRTQSTETWVWVKTFVNLPLTLVFTLSQTPLMSRYALPEDGDGAAKG